MEEQMLKLFPTRSLLMLNKILSYVIISIFSILPTISSATEVKYKIHGVDQKTKDLISTELPIRSVLSEEDASQLRIKALHKATIQEIYWHLESIGYYHAKIDNLLQQINEVWHAEYFINLGTPTIVDEFSLKLIGPGKDNQQLNESLNKLIFNLGKPVNHSEYEEFKQFLITTLFNHGYIHAMFNKSTIEVNRSTKKAKIFIVLETNQQAYFSTTKFVNPPYTTDFLKKFIPYVEGEAFNNDKLTEFKQNLESSGLFSKIRIEPKPELNDLNNQKVPVNVRLELRAKNRYSGKIGYGTDTNMRAGFDWQHFRTSKDGHKVNLSFTASGIKKDGLLSYSIPGTNPATDKYLFEADIEELSIDDNYSQKNQASIRKAMQRTPVQSIWSLSYFSEKYRFTKTEDMQQHKYLQPSLYLKYLNYDPKVSQQGTSSELQLRGGMDMLLSATNYAQAKFTLKHIHTLEHDVRAIFKGVFGVCGVGEINKLPVSLRFFAGGDQSIRGYKRNALAPFTVDSNGKQVAVGGKHLLLLTAEVDKELYQDLRFAVFADSGNAFNCFNSINLATGVGVGMRLQTKIGAFRVDLAKPLKHDARGEKNSLRLHLSFGADL